MGLSPGENPASFRNREMVRRLWPLFEKQLRHEMLRGRIPADDKRLSVEGSAAETLKAMEYHLRQALAVELQDEIIRARPPMVMWTDEELKEIRDRVLS